MRNYKATQDVVIREITIFKLVEGNDLADDEARRAAEDILDDEGSGDDWSYDDVIRLSYDRVTVRFVGI
jgi:hypothetical protein